MAAEIAAALGVSPGRVSQWLSRTIKEEKDRKREKALDLWQACYTLDEISSVVGVHLDTISEWSKGFSENLAAKESENWSGFPPPLYNVWKQQNKSNAVGHFGKTTEQKAREFRVLKAIEEERAKRRMLAGKAADPKPNLAQGQSRDGAGLPGS